MIIRSSNFPRIGVQLTSRLEFLKLTSLHYPIQTNVRSIFSLSYYDNGELMKENTKTKKLFEITIQKLLSKDNADTDGHIIKYDSNEEIISIMNSLIKKADRGSLHNSLLHLVLSINPDITIIPRELSNKLLDTIKKKGNRFDIQKWRNVLANPRYHSVFQFDMINMHSIIERCSSGDLSSVDEAIQWLMMAQESYRLTPTTSTYSVLIHSAVRLRLWDLLIYLQVEMKSHNLPLNRSHMSQILSIALESTTSSWRYIRKLLLNLSTKTNTTTTSEKPSQYLLSSIDLATGFKCMIVSKEFSVARSLYYQLMNASNLLPITNNTMILPLGEIAFRLNDFDLLSHVLYDNIQAKMLISSDISEQSMLLHKYSPSSKEIMNNTLSSNSNITTATTSSSISSSQMMSASQLNWLTDYTNIILGDSMQQQTQQLEVHKYGRPIGLAIAWLLCHHQLDKAIAIWNIFINSLQTSQKSSIVADSTKNDRAISDILHLICLSCQEPLSNLHAFKDINIFLRNALVPPQSDDNNNDNNSVSQQQQYKKKIQSSVDIPIATDLLDKLIHTFSILCDADAAAVVLANSLKNGELVSEKSMTSILQLIQKEQHDHRLVIELFDMYMDISENSLTNHVSSVSVSATKTSREFNAKNNRKSLNSNNNNNKIKNKVNKDFTKPSLQNKYRLLSPYLYSAVIHSMLKLGELEEAIKVLRDVLPSKGYIPRIGFYTTVIEALCKHGLYQEGYHLYLESQVLYTSIRRSNPRDSLLYEGYGVSDKALIDLALQCCAKLKLNIEALQILSSVEESQRIGKQKIYTNESRRFVKLVIISLATQDSIKILPQVLKSLDTFQLALILNEELIVISLAVAISMHDRGVVIEIVKLMKEQFNKAPNELINLTDLLARMKKELDYDNVQEITSFIKHNCFDILNY